MRALIAALLITVPTLGTAGEFQHSDGTWWNTIDAPAKWLNKPYAGHIEVIERPAGVLLEICSRATGKAEPFGCAFVLNSPTFGLSCDINVSEALPPDMRENIVAHEEAHCRGWPADHPQD